MKDWIKRNERKLWWAFLAVTIVIGILRDPKSYDDTPLWTYVVPIVIVVVFMVWTLYEMRKMRKRHERVYRESLDGLAEEFPTGTRIRYRMGSTEPIGTVHGVTWSLPRQPGGPKVAALVIDTIHNTIGHVYPNEVTRKEEI